MKKYFNSKNIVTAFGFLGLYLISAGISWAVFSTGAGGVSEEAIDTSELASARSKLDSTLPKTEECPINGDKFTKIEKNIWEARRPIAAMIENHADSRPQSGLSKADVIYEIVAEGGITRFMSIFYCGIASKDVQIAPVRSARIYFVNLAAEYGDKPIFTHVGGANNICGNCPGGVKPAGSVGKEVRAIEELVSLGWRVAGGNDFDTTFDSGYPVFWRNYERLDHPVATEHTMMSSSDKIYEAAATRGLNAKDEDGKAWNEDFVQWKFMDDAPVSSPNASKISFEFWSNKPEYDVEWQYDKANNKYLRSNGGSPHTDLENKEQLAAKNVVVVFLKERGPVDKELHMFYQVVGTGDMILFQNGEVIEGTWEKEKQASRMKFYDESGKEVSLVRGTTWVEGVPDGNEIVYN
jgi:hypothetical protein